MSETAAKKATVLIVDDKPSNVDVLVDVLDGQYLQKVALNGEKALQIAGSDDPPDVILLDVMMPGMDGYEVCRRLKAHERTRNIPVIFVTAMDDIRDEAAGFDAGCVDYITKPVSPPLVLARIATHVKLYDQERHLQGMVRQRTKELEKTRLEVIKRLGRAAEYKDDETGLHVIRMSHYAKLLALAHGMAPEEAEVLYLAAPMHDVGKLGIPDRILQKSGPLDDEEWKIMRRHPAIGAAIIGKQQGELLEMARIISLTHHEKWDGSGYPRGLKGEEIPLCGRIIAIADVFDALTSERPYKKQWEVDEAVEFMQQQAGLHFDPELIIKFTGILPAILNVRDQYMELPVQVR